MLNIEINQGGQILERRRCRLYRLPDGACGALVDGVVFPLRPGPAVELTSAWLYPGDCTLLLEPPAGLEEMLVTATTKWWSLEPGDHYRYLLLDLAEPALGEAAKALDSTGFAVSRHGDAFAPAGDGRHFRSFIRLEPAGEVGGNELARLALALQPFAALAAAADGASPGDHGASVDAGGRWKRAEASLARREEELALQRVATGKALSAAAEQRRHSAVELDLLRAALTAQRERLAAMEQSLIRMSAEVARLQADSSAMPAPGADTAQLKRDLDTALDEWAAAAAALEQEKKDRDAFEARNAALEGEVERLSQAAQMPAVAAGRPSRAARLREDLAAMVGALLPRLNLVRGSADFLANEVSDWSTILAMLAQLQNDPAAVPSKRVKSSGDWLERHFNTGRGDIGRLYWRSAGPRLDVLVSDKGAQPRDFAWMKL